MPYERKPLPFDPGKLRGLSERLIVSHHENNYGGAVSRLNAIAARLAELDFATVPGFVVNGLKREELIAMNSMILHELYFESLGGEGELPPGALHDRLARDGSLLAWSARAGRLINQWAADHTHVLAEARPLLALDMYEHSYHIDYGAKAAAYVDAFMNNVDWRAIEESHVRLVREGK